MKRIVLILSCSAGLYGAQYHQLDPEVKQAADSATSLSLVQSTKHVAHDYRQYVGYQIRRNHRIAHIAFDEAHNTIALVSDKGFFSLVDYTGGSLYTCRDAWFSCLDRLSYGTLWGGGCGIMGAAVACLSFNMLASWMGPSILGGSCMGLGCCIKCCCDQSVCQVPDKGKTTACAAGHGIAIMARIAASCCCPLLQPLQEIAVVDSAGERRTVAMYEGPPIVVMAIISPLQFVTADSDGALLLWSYTKPSQEANGSLDKRLMRVCKGFPVACIVQHILDEKCIVLATRTGAVVVCPLPEINEKAEMREGAVWQTEAAISSLAVSDDGYIFTGSKTGVIGMWDSKGTLCKEMHVPSTIACSISTVAVVDNKVRFAVEYASQNASCLYEWDYTNDCVCPYQKNYSAPIVALAKRKDRVTILAFVGGIIQFSMDAADKDTLLQRCSKQQLQLVDKIIKTHEEGKQALPEERSGDGISLAGDDMSLFLSLPPFFQESLRVNCKVSLG